MTSPRFAIIEVKTLNKLFNEIKYLKDSIQKLHFQKELPEPIEQTPRKYFRRKRI